MLSACTGSPSDGGPVSIQQIDTALAAHARAVRDHDRGAFLSGIDDRKAASAFRARQADAFGNLRRIPFRTWALTVSAPVKQPGPQAAARSKFGSSARIVRVTLRYAISGVDPVPTRHSLWLTLARVGGQVVICADDGLARQGGVSWRGPWDFGTITVVRDAHSLVLGPPAQLAELRQVAAVADRAVPAVTAVWGTRWARDVAVVVPGSTAALAAALGDVDAGSGSSGSADVSAVTVSDGQDPLTGQVQGQRIVVTTDGFDRLSPLGRQIVLTHEITHVASAAATGGASPRWLVEGLAEYVANLHTGQPVRTVASELVQRVRADGLPGELPADTAFDQASTAAAAYEQGWLACRLIAQRVGVAGLIAVYRRVGESGLDTATAVESALRAVLHESTATFTAQWRSYLQAQLR